MKIMISQPMKGLTYDVIRANRAEIKRNLEQMGHVVLDNIFTDEPEDAQSKPLYYLAKSFSVMAKVDAVLFMNGWQANRGCIMEHAACVQYGITKMYENY